jgi:hypothetical protein
MALRVHECEISKHVLQGMRIHWSPVALLGAVRSGLLAGTGSYVHAVDASARPRCVLHIQSVEGKGQKQTDGDTAAHKTKPRHEATTGNQCDVDDEQKNDHQRHPPDAGPETQGLFGGSTGGYFRRNWEIIPSTVDAGLYVPPEQGPCSGSQDQRSAPGKSQARFVAAAPTSRNGSENGPLA